MLKNGEKNVELNCSTAFQINVLKLRINKVLNFFIQG
jgi:hypothetical protein